MRAHDVLGHLFPDFAPRHGTGLKLDAPDDRLLSEVEEVTVNAASGAGQILTRGELFPRVGFIVTNMTAGPEGVVRFYNGRGTAEQWIKEGKYTLNWTRPSCHRFVANRVRLSLFILAYNLGNFLRRLCLPKVVRHWSLRSVQVKLIKMEGRLVRHSRRLIFRLSEVSAPRRLFEGVLDRIGRLSPAPS